MVDYESLAMRLDQLREFVNKYMVEGEDYGKVSSKDTKPTLFKSGADKLCDVFALAPGDPIIKCTRDDSKTPVYLKYEITLPIISRLDGRRISTGVGSCNSYEKKYKWRQYYENELPADIDKSTARRVQKRGKNGPYTVFLLPNDEIDDLDNTILKMAKKRALVDGVLNATRSASLFTQDLDDVQVDRNNDFVEPNNSRNSGSGARSNSPQSEAPIDASKLKLIAKLAGDKGINDQQLRHLVAKEAEGKDIPDLTQQEAIKVIQLLQQYQPQAKETPDPVSQEKASEDGVYEVSFEKPRWIVGVVENVTTGEVENLPAYILGVGKARIAVPLTHPQSELIDDLYDLQVQAKFWCQTSTSGVELLWGINGKEIQIAQADGSDVLDLANKYRNGDKPLDF